jgi:hypothetical protein
MVMRFLLAVLSTSALLSLSAYVALAYWGRSRMLYQSGLDVRPSWREAILLILAAGGFLTCLFQGARAMLFWLPEAWGGVDEYGEYQTLTTSLALLFASGGVFFIAVINNATRDKVWLQASLREVKGLSEILEASLDHRRLAELEARHTKQAASLASSLGVLPRGTSNADIRATVEPTREHVAVLEGLATAAQRQRERLEKGMVR